MHPLRTFFTTTDMDQCADDIAYHVMQEGIGLTVDVYHWSVLLDLDTRQFADRRARLAGRGTKGREIMLSQARAERSA